jgi:hypothetical protein
MRIGLNAFAKADDKLMLNRRVAGAQRILQEEMEGMIPAMAQCTGQSGQRIAFFQGEPAVMRLASTFSLQQGWRGQPQVLEMFVISGEHEQGVRLVVNETPFSGPLAAGKFCLGDHQFLPVASGPQSFVLADRLAYCRFSYLMQLDPSAPPVWQPLWKGTGWPLAVRIEMAPLIADSSVLQPITVSAPIYLHRNPEIDYGDF